MPERQFFKYGEEIEEVYGVTTGGGYVFTYVGPIGTDGEPANVFGVVLARAGFGGGRKSRGQKNHDALKLVLGLEDKEILPQNIAMTLAKMVGALIVWRSLAVSERRNPA
mgnify:CR=1 FL=1